MKKQKKYFIVKRYFHKHHPRIYKDGQVIEQWWIYVLIPQKDIYEPLVGTYELDYQKAKKILLEEYYLIYEKD